VNILFREILNKALQNTGNQENLAIKLDISPSALSKKMKGEAGWNETDLDILFSISEFCDSCKANHHKEIDSLADSLRVILERRNT
jgi:uncharacterized protein YggU (UPF0235/DUF167 family)